MVINESVTSEWKLKEVITSANSKRINESVTSLSASLKRL